MCVSHNTSKNSLNCSLSRQSFLLIHVCSVFISAVKNDTEEEGTVGGIGTWDLKKKASALFSWLSHFTDSEQLVISLSIALIMFSVRDISHGKGQDSNFILSWTEYH